MESRGRYLHALHGEDFNDVAYLDVVEAFEADAAFEAGLHFADVVLEAAQRADLAFEHHDVVAQQTRCRLARARDAAVRHHAAGNRADLRHAEYLSHFGGAHAHFLERRFEETFHALLDLLGDVVDHRVQAHVHLLAIGHGRGVP